MLVSNFLRYFKMSGKWKSKLIKVFFLVFTAIICFEVHVLLKNENIEIDEMDTSFGIEDDYSEDLRPLDKPETLTSGASVQLDDHWQPVLGTRHKFYVYSAYHDKRQMSHIRVVGVTRPSGSDKVLCQTSFKDDPRTYSQPATVKPTGGNVRLPFAAVFITCELPHDSGVPSYVSIVSASLSIASNLLKVHVPTAPVAGGHTIAACVQPVDTHFAQTIRLIEFIEMNTLVGVSHFYFYNHSMSEEVRCVLSDYVQQGRVTVQSWKFNMWNHIFNKNSLNESVHAAMNDCVYRSMYKYTYTTFLRTDEFVVPKITKTLQELVRNKGIHSKPNQVGSYSFKKAYFYLEWPDSTWSGFNSLGNFVMTIYKTRRTDKESSPDHATYLCQPESVLELGTFLQAKLLPGFQTVNMDQSEALSHQYSTCGGSTVDCNSVVSTVDVTAHKHAKALLQAMLTQWNKAMPLCTLEPVSPKDKHRTRIMFDKIVLV